jgi:hypothetical protein
MTRHLAHERTLSIDQTRSRPSTPPGARQLLLTRPRNSQVTHLPFLHTADDSNLATDVKSKKTTKKPYRGKDATTRKPPIPTSKGKRKAPQEDEDTATATVGSVNDDKAAKSTKLNSEKDTKVPPIAAAVDGETNDVAMPRKKKMRKLNIANPFASAQPQSLDWANQFNVVSVVDAEVPYYPANQSLRVMAV